MTATIIRCTMIYEIPIDLRHVSFPETAQELHELGQWIDESGLIDSESIKSVRFEVGDRINVEYDLVIYDHYMQNMSGNGQILVLSRNYPDKIPAPEMPKPLWKSLFPKNTAEITKFKEVS